jgi:hypothetical protein
MSQRGKVEKYISSVFPNAPGISWMNTIGLFKDLEKQHDFGKFGLTATAINDDAADYFKTEEAKAVSITEAASKESETGDDANTIRAFLNIATNSEVYIPRPPTSSITWGRVTASAATTAGAFFHGAAPTGEIISPNISSRAQKYDTPWIHKCYFKFLNASSEEKYWRITAVYSKNLHPIRRAKNQALRKGPKGSDAWVKYKLFAARMDLNSYKHVLKGINLLRALEIPNHSMCVRDMEGGAGAFFKAIRGRNPTIVVGPNTGDTYDDTRDLMRMYSYADCVTDSDPNKSKVYCDNFGIFNTDSQVIISAITNKKQITVKAHNPQLRMKFNITHTTGGGPQKSWKTYSNTAKQISAGKNGNVNLRIGKVKQVWSQPSTIPDPKVVLNPSAFIIPNAPEDNEAAEIVNSWEEVPHTNTGASPPLRDDIEGEEDPDILRGILQDRGLSQSEIDDLSDDDELEEAVLKSCGYPEFYEILETFSDSGLSPISLQSAAYGLQRKQGGDRFQGWQVRNLKNITSRVVEHCWNFDGQNAPTPMPKRSISGTSYYGTQTLGGIWTRGQGDAFVITGDIPFLCWCLRNDVNVLFGSLGDEGTPENPKFVYFRVQD